MRPKPTRDWVMLELERLGVRVVSGRLGRKAGEEEEGEGVVKPGGKLRIWIALECCSGGAIYDNFKYYEYKELSLNIVLCVFVQKWHAPDHLSTEVTVLVGPHPMQILTA
jgi:hypothetical protein